MAGRILRCRPARRLRRAGPNRRSPEARSLPSPSRGRQGWSLSPMRIRFFPAQALIFLPFFTASRGISSTGAARARTALRDFIASGYVKENTGNGLAGIASAVESGSGTCLPLRMAQGNSHSGGVRAGAGLDEGFSMPPSTAIGGNGFFSSPSLPAGILNLVSSIETSLAG